MSSQVPEPKVQASCVVRRHLVIVIDDSPDVLDTASRYLKAKGLEVVTSTHGFDLASLIARRTPDAVVLDVMLPTLAGSTLAQIVRKRAPAVPIVFYSAIPEDKGKELLDRVPGAVFVPKTRGVAALHHGLSALMAEHSSAARG